MPYERNTTMSDTGIESLAKGFAQTGSRRTLLKGIAGGVAAALLGVGTHSGALAADGVEGFVVDYYQAIAAHDYKRAYDLLGAKFHHEQSYHEFKTGFADTAYVKVDIRGTESIGNNQYRVKV